jgi:DNA-directed RNA polymerase specialized sigma24 family protein
VYNYTRRMLKNNLRRHLIRARTRQGREVLLSHSELLYRYEAQMAAAPALGYEWNDRDWLRHRVIGRVIKASDKRTRELVQFRCADPVMTYGEIAQRCGTSEAALRMRMARFYETVRKVHALASNINSEPTYS